MDPKRFDQISKSLAAGTSRRTFVKGLSGGMLAGALAIAGMGRAGAKPAAKVGICHHTDSASNPIELITVAANAVPDHLAHGDTLLGTVDGCSSCGDVCTSEDVCFTAVCEGGSCGSVAVEPINCVVSDWSEWSDCSAECDGTTTRTRTVTTEASCGGTCLEELTVTVPCNTDACVPDDLCDEGYEAVNGGCFQIVDAQDPSLCTNQCGVYGSVVGSDHFMCAARVPGTTCSSNSDCASGTACSSPNFRPSCIRVC